MDILQDFLSLIYPRTCVACGNSLWKHEKTICTLCLHRLPKTLYHLDPDNNVIRIFRGRIPVEAAAAFYFFSRGTRVRHMIHQLKYKGRKDVGVFLGEKYGRDLRDSSLFRGIDTIVPVPLHRRKQAIRGYNQSEQFAIGLGMSMGLPVDGYSLWRMKGSETQTRKSRYSRWENVSELFGVRNREKLEGKHILLVDDVITTGATLEACAQALLTVPGVRISIASIAVTMI
jgi:ComF family protein